MAKYPVRLLEKGRVTIPKDAREDLDVEKGDYVVIEVSEFES